MAGILYNAKNNGITSIIADDAPLIDRASLR